MKEITVNGKALPIHFGMKAINEFCKSAGAEFSDTATSTEVLGNIESIVTLTVSGLNEGARKTGGDKRYAEDDVWDMLDDNPGLILDISEIFVESIAPLTDKLGGMVKNGERPTAKKRGTK